VTDVESFDGCAYIAAAVAVIIVVFALLTFVTWILR
jgi:hypothetical protein